MSEALDIVFAALADPTRRAILAMLLEDDMAVTDVAEPFQFTRLLSTESQLLSWKQSGLPADSLSRENAIVIVQGGASRVPFIIDPANAAGSWLKVGSQSHTTSMRPYVRVWCCVSNLLSPHAISPSPHDHL